MVTPTSLREECPDLRAVLGALLDDAGPAGVISLLQPSVGIGALELDHLDAGGLLPSDVLLVLLGGFRCLTLDPCGGVADDLLLPVAELRPGALVDQDAHLGAVETGVDAVLGLLVP